MNYLKHYIKLVRRAETRENLPSDLYVEKHHIFPVSLFGKNNRIVKLTAREHVIAHFLLWKLCKKRYGEVHFRTIKMFYAFNMMTWDSVNHKRNGSHLYKYAKETQSMLMKIRLPSKNIEARKKISASKRGKQRIDLVGKQFFGTNKDIVDIKDRAAKSKKQTMNNNKELYGRCYKPSTSKRKKNPTVRRSKKKCI